MSNDPASFPVALIVYSDAPSPALRLTLEALSGAADSAADAIHVVLDWDPAEPAPDPADPLFGTALPRLHRAPERRGFYPSVRAAIDAIGAAHIGLIRQGCIVTPTVIATLVRGIVHQGYAAVSPLTNHLTGFAVPLARGENPLTVNARLALSFGVGAITPAPLIDLGVMLLSRAALYATPFPHFADDSTEQSLVRFLRALDERGQPLGICLDAYAYHLPAASPVNATVDDAAAIDHLSTLVPRRDRVDLQAQLTTFAAAQSARRAQFLRERPVLTAPATLCVLMSSLMLRGGVIVLVNWINQLILRGLDVRVYVQNLKQRPDPGLRLLFAPKPFASNDSMAGELPPGTRIVATFWATAETACELVWRVPRARGYYFIQDDERRFYRDEGREADLRRRATASYSLPLTKIVTSRWIAEQLADGDSARYDAIVRIPVGIDLALFPPHLPAPRRRVAPVLVAMARPETPRRGYPLLIAALEQVYRRHPLIDIRLFGSDSLSDLPFPCESLGQVAPDDLRALYRDADLFVDTSDFQGFGLAPLEAMALGCACVLTDSGGINEYAQDGINALITPRDPAAVAAALCELIEHPAQREQLARAAVETARRFDCVHTTDGWLRYFQMEDHPCRSPLAGDGLPTTSRRSPLAGDQVHASRPQVESYDLVVVIPIYNQLHAVRRCIESVLPTLGATHHLLLIDDHSDQHTATQLDAIAASHPRVTCLHNAINLGFVGAANRGMAWAGERGRDVILLNSDTIVVPGWLERLAQAAIVNPEAGLISPLSTASSHLYLRLAPGQSFLAADRWLEQATTPVYPTVITPEGWCLYIRHAVWQRLGGFDPIFGRGYCEESDCCLRAVAIGWRLAACDNLMIYHQGQVTFGGQRSTRYQHNRRIFDQRWSMIYQRLYRDFLALDPLKPLRADYRRAYGEPVGDRLQATDAKHPDLLAILADPALETDLRAYEASLPARHAQPLPTQPAIVFVLPDLRPFGGTLSVVMLVNDWILAGRDVKVVVLSRKGDDGSHLGLLTAPVFLTTEAKIARDFPPADLAIGTLWITLYPLARLAAQRPDLQLGYFVQDFEADFPDVVARDLRQQVLRTYRWSVRAFAKTPWIVERVRATGGACTLVPPALDLDLFYPRDRVTSTRQVKTLIAMLRPGSPQRDPDTLLAVFARLRREQPDLRLETFGCRDDDLPDSARDLIDQHHGFVANADLPALYAQADFFLDTSVFHGFGRVIAEAMACGLVCVVTASGGIDTFARPDDTCLIAPPGDVDGLVRHIQRLQRDDALRQRLITAARQAVEVFSPTVSAQRTAEIVLGSS